MEKNKKIITDRDECLRYIETAFAGNIDLDIISEELKYDPEIIEQSIIRNQNLINQFSKVFIDSNYSNTMRNLFERFGSELFTRISPDLKENGKFMAKVVEAYPNGYYYVKDGLRNNIAFKRECEIRLEDVAKQFESAGDKNYSDYVLEMKNKFKQDNINIAKNIYGLNEEKYELLKHYPGTLEKLSNIKNCNIFKACLEHVNSKNLELTEWTNELNNLIDRFNDKNYEELLSSIDTQNIDIEKLNKILEQPNYFNIKNHKDVELYQEIKEEVCDAIVAEDQEKISYYPLIAEMKSEDKLKFAVLQKLMGYDLEQAKDIRNRYLCIDEVKANDPNDVKSWVTSIKEIVDVNDKETLKKLYSLEPVPAKAQDKSVLEQEAKSLYMQEYNQTLFDPEKGERIEVKDIAEYLPDNIDKNKYKFINAGTEFNMIMTAVGAYSYSSSNDYAKAWNREITNSRGFSCSYIGNDMIASAPIKDVCYGFSKMENDSLLLAGSHNLGSATNQEELVIDKSYVDYQRPEYLKNSTIEHNEMVFKREQNGKRKQPDYLLLFKHDGKIPNMESTLKAVDDFKKAGIDLPIVVVDVERCIESEKLKVENLLKEAEEKNNPQLLEKAEQKLQCNSKTMYIRNSNIFSGYYKKISSLYNQIFVNNPKSKNKVKEETYHEAYEQTEPEERREEVSKIVQLQRKIMAIIKGKEVNENER